jgi:hypothetical protein
MQSATTGRALPFDGLHPRMKVKTPTRTSRNQKEESLTEWNAHGIVYLFYFRERSFP